MRAYSIAEVDGVVFADALRSFNALEPHRFPPLQARHFELGYWWLAHAPDGVPVGFAGLVPMTPFPGVGYLKRAYVSPDHRGHGLQLEFMAVREAKARLLGWTMLVSECAADNVHSASNFLKAGFERCEPEQPWGESNAVFFIKRVEARPAGKRRRPQQR